MAKLISGSIDLNKIDRSKVKKHDNGALYYEVNISINDTANQFGQDVSIYDSQTKEEKEAKKNRNYLGNGKVVWSNDGQAQQSSASNSAKMPWDDDVNAGQQNAAPANQNNNSGQSNFNPFNNNGTAKDLPF